MRQNLLLFVLLFSGQLTTLSAQRALLQSGPMLGYVDMKEALLWAQTTQAASVHFEYWDKESPETKYLTEKVRTEKSTGYAAKCIADQVEPGRMYLYQLYINDIQVSLPYPTEFKTQALWQWRTDPPAFSVATGSCAYINEPPYDRPGAPYGSNYGIFTQIAAQKPDLMLWLGDNVYYREPDWTTRTGMLHRNTHARSLPEMQALLASTQHYAIWDDHDFGPNDSDGTWVHKETAWDVFQAFWGNPTFGVNGQKGCTTWFQYADMDFFLLDDRYFRTPNYCKSCERTMLGKEQREWFLAALTASRAPFKIVAIGAQVLTPVKKHERYSNLFEAERDSILAHIERENIKGVIFLTGDVHFTEMNALKNARGNWVYDLTTSPLTSGVNPSGLSETNGLRVEGTAVAQHNFSLLRFSGPRTARQLDITVFGADGKTLWNKTIGADGEIKK